MVFLLRNKLKKKRKGRVPPLVLCRPHLLVFNATGLTGGCNVNLCERSELQTIGQQEQQQQESNGEP